MINLEHFHCSLSIRKYGLDYGFHSNRGDNKFKIINTEIRQPYTSVVFSKSPKDYECGNECDREILEMVPKPKVPLLLKKDQADNS